MSITPRPEYFDVIIVGAGISGVGSAYHLRDQCPGKSFLILEEMDSFGGTWLTHSYPGIRSDSDLYTFGYRFKPWTKAPIASREEILHYLGEVIFENDLDRHIRYHHHVTAANWSGKDKLWTLEGLTIAQIGAARRLSCYGNKNPKLRRLHNREPNKDAA